MATVNSSSGVVGGGCETPRSSDRSPVPSSSASQPDQQLQRREVKLSQSSSAPASHEPSASSSLVTPSSPDSRPRDTQPNSSQESATVDQQALVEELHRMPVDEFQALLEAAYSNSKIRTQKHAAMFNQLEHSTKASPEEQSPSLTSAKYSSSLQSLNQPQQASNSSRGTKGPTTYGGHNSNSTPKTSSPGASSSYNSNSGSSSHTSHNNNYHHHSPHISGVKSSLSNSSSTSQPCSSGDQASFSNSQPISSPNSSGSSSLHNSHLRRDRVSPTTAADEEQGSERFSSSSESESPGSTSCSTTFTAQPPTSFQNHHASNSSMSSLASSSINVNYNFNLRKSTPRPQVENHTEITATATLPSPYFFNIRNEETDGESARVRSRFVKDQHASTSGFPEGELNADRFFLEENDRPSNVHLRGEYSPSANADYSLNYGPGYKESRNSPASAGESASASYTTRAVPVRSTSELDRVERKKAARNNRNKKKETTIQSDALPNYVGKKEVDELVVYIEEAAKTALASSNKEAKLKNKSKKARRREALSKSHSLDENTLGLELNPGIETRSVSSTLVDNKCDSEEKAGDDPVEEASGSTGESTPKKPNTPTRSPKSAGSDKNRDFTPKTDQGTTEKLVETVKESPDKPISEPSSAEIVKTGKPASKKEVNEPKTETDKPTTQGEASKISKPQPTPKAEACKTTVSQDAEEGNRSSKPESDLSKSVRVTSDELQPLLGARKWEGKGAPRPASVDKNRVDVNVGPRPNKADTPPAISPAPATEFITVTNRKKNKVQKPVPVAPVPISQPIVKAFVRSGPPQPRSQYFDRYDRSRPPRPPTASFPGHSRPPLQVQHFVPNTLKSQSNGVPQVTIKTDPTPAEAKAETEVVVAHTPTPPPFEPTLEPLSPVVEQEVQQPVVSTKQDEAKVEVEQRSVSESEEFEASAEPEVNESSENEAVKFCGVNFERQPIPKPKAEFEFGFDIGVNEFLAPESSPPNKGQINCQTTTTQIHQQQIPTALPAADLEPTDLPQSRSSEEYNYSQGGPEPTQNSHSPVEEEDERESLLGRHPEAAVASSTVEQQINRPPDLAVSREEQFAVHAQAQHNYQVALHHQQLQQQQFHLQQQQQQQQQQHILSGYPINPMAAAGHFAFYQNPGFPPPMGYQTIYQGSGQPTPPPHLGMTPTPPPNNQGHQVSVPNSAHIFQLAPNPPFSPYPPPANFQQLGVGMINQNAAAPHQPPPAAQMFIPLSVNQGQGGYMKNIQPQNIVQPYPMQGLAQQAFNAVYSQQPYMASNVIIPQIPAQYQGLPSPGQGGLNQNQIPQVQHAQLLTQVQPPPQVYGTVPQQQQHPGRRPPGVPTPPNIPAAHMQQAYFQPGHCVQPGMVVPMGVPAPVNYSQTGPIVYKPPESPSDVNGNSNLNAVPERESYRGAGRGRRGGRGGHIDVQGRGPRHPNPNYRRPEPAALPALMERSGPRHQNPNPGGYQQPNSSEIYRRSSRPSESPVTSPPMPVPKYEAYNHYHVSQHTYEPQGYALQHGNYYERQPPPYATLYESGQHNVNPKVLKDRNYVPSKESEHLLESNLTAQEQFDDGGEESDGAVSDANEAAAVEAAPDVPEVIYTENEDDAPGKGFGSAGFPANYDCTSPYGVWPGTELVIDTQHRVEHYFKPPPQNDANDAIANEAQRKMNEYMANVMISPRGSHHYIK